MKREFLSEMLCVCTKHVKRSVRCVHFCLADLTATPPGCLGAVCVQVWFGDLRPLPSPSKRCSHHCVCFLVPVPTGGVGMRNLCLIQMPRATGAVCAAPSAGRALCSCARSSAGRPYRVSPPAARTVPSAWCAELPKHTQLPMFRLE